MIKIDKLNPFGRLCVTLGMLPSSYTESLTYEEQLLWMLNYLEKTIIPTINNNAQAVEELQALYLELKSYVDNYFTNLDVQQEINNKLDQMAVSGQLTDIIAQYLQLAGILVYNSVTDMKQATNLTNGSLTETYGYYSYGDGGSAKYKIRNITTSDVVDDGYIIPINSTLVAELITDEINVRQFGAKGDGTTDDTLAFKKAINIINKLDKPKLIIPVGNYIISDTLTLKSNNVLSGVHKYKSIITQKTNECLNKPLISSDITDEMQLSDIKLENLSIVLNGERTVDAITIYNTTNTEINNCFISGTSNSLFNGIVISKTKNFTGENFVSKIHDSRLSMSTLKLNSTDSYVERNELWGNSQSCALLIENSNNSIISNNEIIGGSTYGGIYFNSIGEKTNYQIIGNYFDGSYDSIDTKYGIYSDATLVNCLISDNKFWKQKSGPIKLLNAQGCIISNNNFIENDYYNNGESEIYIGTSPTIASFGNTINGNTFERYKCLDENKTTVITRPTTNPPAIMIINASSGGYPTDVISNNTLYYSQFYSTLQRNSEALKSYNNNHKYFSYSNVDYGSDSDANGFKELVFDNQTDANLLNLHLYSKNPTRGDFEIGNNKTYIVTSFYNTSNHLDASNPPANTFKLFLNNPTIVDNIPPQAQTGVCVLENLFIDTGYQFQRLTTKTTSYTRIQENGNWSSWIE